VTARGGAIVAAALLLASSCGNTAREGEIACQQRLVDLSSRDFLSPGAAEGFERMELDGCSEDQRLRARLTARAARELAATFARIRGPLPPSRAAPESRREAIAAALRQLEQAPSLREAQPFLEFQSQLEQYERRRQILREDLERMRREGG
jgi:hypothetical protein